MTRFANMFPIHFPSPEGQTYRDNYDAIDWGTEKLAHEWDETKDGPRPMGLRYQTPATVRIPHILLVGFKRAGKDTTAQIIQEFLENRGLACRTHALAAPIKETCGHLFGWDNDYLNGEFKEAVDPVWGFSPRRAQQLLGTEFGRALDPDLWIQMWWHKADYDETAVSIAPDGRFLSEARYFKRLGGQVWVINRPGCKPGDHASERDQNSVEMLELADKVITNDGTLGELRYQVILALQDLLALEAP